ncbi:MAG: LysR family transcriptional regulator [Proteobacteria bacterium]|nr:LysR family transcriptional regulator [Pseudomonadota bacterium]
MELHQIDLNKLHTFFAVAEHAGVTAAARHLALTPSAVSQSLSALEDGLDVRLFHRVGRRLVLTREGELLYRRFREYQVRLAQTLTEVRNEEREPRGLIRLGLFVGFPRERLASFLAAFSRAHEKVRVKLLYGSRDELVAGLLEGRMDAVLSFEPEGDASGRIEATRLFREELVLVGAASLLRGRFSLDVLGRVPVVDYYQSDPLIHRWIAYHFRRKPPRLNVRIWAATTNLALDLILKRVGVGILPRHVAAPFVARKRLRLVEPGKRVLTDSMWWKELSSPGARASPALEAFREAAIEAFSDLALD